MPRINEKINRLENIIYTYPEKIRWAIQATIIKCLVPHAQKWGVMIALRESDSPKGKYWTLIDEISTYYDLKESIYQKFQEIVLNWSRCESDSKFLFMLQENMEVLRKFISDEVEFQYNFCLFSITKDDIFAYLNECLTLDQFHSRCIGVYEGRTMFTNRMRINQYTKFWYPKYDNAEFRGCERIMKLVRGDEEQGMIRFCTGKLIELFPDIDPEYIDLWVGNYYNEPLRMKSFIKFLRNTDRAPKKRSYDRRQVHFLQKQNYMNQLAVENFCKEFPNPEMTFSVKEELWAIYKKDCIQELSDRFPLISIEKIRECLARNYRYVPTYKKLKLQKPDRTTQRPPTLIPPSNKDFLLLYEIYYIEKEIEIHRHFKDQAKIRYESLIQAELNSSLQSCLICLETGFLEKEMTTCRKQCNEHFPICVFCFQRFIELSINSKPGYIKCYEDNCPNLIAPQKFREFSKPSVCMSSNFYANSSVIEKIGAIDKRNILKCNYCGFANIDFSNKDTIYCRNLACCLIHCRKCGGSAHFDDACPLRKWLREPLI